MKPFYVRVVLFWFCLLAAALINATIRETTYKPLLTPSICAWAHQISSLTGILLFYTAIYLFLTRIRVAYARKDLVWAGVIWIGMTLIFETFMNIYLRKMSFSQVLETYYFWKGETWIFVLLSLLVIPQLVYRRLQGFKTRN